MYMRRRVRLGKNPVIPVRALRPALHIFVYAFVLLLCHWLHPLYCGAQQTRATDAQIKAAYLYNFGKFVRWQPAASSSESFDICVLGKNPFGSALTTTVSGEKIDGKTIVVKYVSNTSDAARCRILFIGSSEEGRLKSVLATARQWNLLTVSDIHGFAQRGGMIELMNQEDRVRFAVNVTATSEAGLSVSSELLKVATKVIGTHQAKEIDK
jgi:hypothetical protein